jgi:tight adherence protein C
MQTPVPPPAVTVMGVDVIWVATMLAAVGVVAVFFAIYTASTVRDPMARRVKSLNERREQLKAGITAPTAKRRAKLVRKNESAQQMRGVLARLKVLQDDHGAADYRRDHRGPADLWH